MKFCQAHWDRLREAIDARGLGSLVPESGEEAARRLVRDTNEGTSIDTFDPLMGAHNAIWSRAMSEIRDKYQQNPLMLMADPDEHPEWACPVCALSWCHAEHDRLCTQEGCNYPKDFDWATEMIDGAADFMLSEWQRLGGRENDE